MIKYVDHTFISNLLDKTDIVYLIKNKIKLKKVGENFFGLCPFHIEKNPSFVVNSSKQLYHCFGCGVHGNIINFVMNYDHLSFLEGIESIANIFKIPILDNNSYMHNKIPENYLLYKLIFKINNFYKNFLYNTISGKAAYKYLLNRGFNQNIIKYFSIGFSPLNWINQIPHNQKNISILHKKLGILKIDKKYNKYYDIFYNRIIFPIRNIKGFIVGFGGRIIKKKNPKYLNSSENIIFHKSNELYGLYETKKENNNIIKKILVVEGYTDVISLFQFNIKYAVATMGTAITSIHIKKIFNLTNKIIYCYDGDEAGKEANWKALKVSLAYLKYGKEIRFIILPNGEDPDSLIKKEGKIIFQKRINNTLSFSEFFFQRLLSKNFFSSCEEKTQFSHKALSLIRLVPDYLFKINLIKKLGEKIGIINLLDIYNLSNYKKNIIINKNLKKTTIRRLLSLLIQNPKLIKLVPKLKFFKTSNINGLFFFIKFVNLYKNKNITTVKILEEYKGTKLKKILEILVTWNHMIFDNKIENFFIYLINKLKINILENRQEYLIFLDRKKGLNFKEKKELWSLNKILIKKKNNLKF
ncbi:DNA primase [Enterobacteriaceae endosymbiont of Donacia versicolorea]|uniref:DNA primase n=1 Tax=Enterobacteriaceae endosymbiont of Donacia versicolorea TaxID=2675788 RepID=UPI0014496B49|nr:DNA primase [Enterobacteriaceae endosymbiont of Donacia versicolorea]QJC32095.1 DNA primase [Enterobacteriaceae endosymbiont of Donacia versicolorea]